MIHVSFTKQFVLDLNQEISDDNVFNGAAALGFYLMLAIFPAMILLMTIIPYLPIDQVDKAIMDLLGQALPAEAYDIVKGVVTEVTRDQRGGLLSFSLLGTLWAASLGMIAIMNQLNLTYNVKEGRNFVHARLTALILSLLFALLVIGAFSLIVLGGVMQDWLGDRFGFSNTLLLIFSLFRWIVILLALFLGFAVIYQYAPDVEQKFVFITFGSVLGVTLLFIVSLAFALYTSNFADYSATYGSIGAVIILMLWLYICRTGYPHWVGSQFPGRTLQPSREGKRRKEGR